MADYEHMTTAELAALAESLAEEKRSIRDQQNEVQAELDLRRALETLSGPSRRIIEARMGGAIAPEGAPQSRRKGEQA